MLNLRKKEEKQSKTAMVIPKTLLKNIYYDYTRGLTIALGFLT